MRLRAVIYCRCSTEEERQIDALKKQVIEAKACVKENDWELVDSYVESKSGTTSKGRLEYSRLFEDLLANKFDIIVIKSQDRLMRNTKDWYLFLDRMLTNRKRLYLYLDRKFYTAEDSLITGIKAILAEEFSRELSKKIVNAHKHRQKSGTKALITNATFGFIKNHDGSVSVDLSRKDALIRMYHYVCDYGCRTTANILEAEGVISKKGKPMNAASIRRTIRNPINKGIFVMNKTHFDFETKRTIKNPKEEWIYAEGLVPAIVDPELWQRANDAITSRAREGNVDGSYVAGSNPGKYILSGKMVCGICGRPYYRSWRRSYSDKNQKVYGWRCSGYVEHGRVEKNRRDMLRKTEALQYSGCDNSHLEEEGVFEVLEKLNAEFFQKENKSNVIQKTIQILEKVLGQNDEQLVLSKLEQELEEINKRKQTLLEKLLDGVISDMDYRTFDKKYEAILEEKREERDRIQSKNNERLDLERRLNGIKQSLEDGGFEKAATDKMLNYVRKIVVHEWQLEVQFDSLKMAGIDISPVSHPDSIFSEIDGTISVFVDYPFAPTTEKGRYLEELEVISYLQRNPKTNVRDMAQKLGKTHSMTLSRIRRLKEKGYVQYSSKNGRGQWQVLKELPDPRKAKQTV